MLRVSKILLQPRHLISLLFFFSLSQHEYRLSKFVRVESTLRCADISPSKCVSLPLSLLIFICTTFPCGWKLGYQHSGHGCASPFFLRANCTQKIAVTKYPKI